METTFLKFLKQFAFFNPEETELILSKFETQKLKKGSFFLKSKQVCERFGFLHSGYLRIFFEGKDKEITQWISSPQSLVTDLASFVFQSPARWSIEALTDCEMLVIKKKDYEFLKKQIPKWIELDALFLSKCFISLEERVFNQFMMTAEERYHELFAQKPEIFNYVPLQYIASMLGMTPETLSRLRKKEKNVFS